MEVSPSKRGSHRSCTSSVSRDSSVAGRNEGLLTTLEARSRSDSSFEVTEDSSCSLRRLSSRDVDHTICTNLKLQPRLSTKSTAAPTPVDCQSIHARSHGCRWIWVDLGSTIPRCRDRDPGGPPVVPRVLRCSVCLSTMASHESIAPTPSFRLQ